MMSLLFILISRQYLQATLLMAMQYSTALQRSFTTESDVQLLLCVIQFKFCGGSID